MNFHIGAKVRPINANKLTQLIVRVITFTLWRMVAFGLSGVARKIFIGTVVTMITHILGPCEVAESAVQIFTALKVLKRRCKESILEYYLEIYIQYEPK
jgi:hypothetical protein